MNVQDQVDERKDKIPMQTSEQSWLSISQKMKKIYSLTKTIFIFYIKKNLQKLSNSFCMVTGKNIILFV